MKHVTASEARKNWFKLLDEASNGESIAINRNGKNLVLRLEVRKKREKIPDYSRIIQITGVDNADKWGWKWTERRGLTPVTKR
jgi:antitoxin (DNA-binding transcriptional repressor) of toxin-antitoxin stability system